MSTLLDPANEALIYAFTGLLSNLGISVDLNELRESMADQEVSFDTLTEGEYVHIVERGGYGSWPTSNNAIIQFQYQDIDDPYIEHDDGSRDANIKDHYCLVADFEHRTIVDSADGVIKEPNLYGLPVSWAVFEPGSAPKAPKPQIDTERSYRVLKGGESGWEIARKLNIDANILREHNEDDFEDFSNIPEGTILHLPTRLPTTPKNPTTQFEFLRRGLEMHTTRSTRKYSFGNAKMGIRESGPTNRKNKNLMIFCVAHVPVDGEVRTFYMEGTDIDLARKKIKWTVGFRAEDVAEGHVDPAELEAYQPSPEIKAQLEEKIAEAELNRAVAAAAEEENNPPSKRQGSDSLPLDDPDYTADWWKTTYKPLSGEEKSEVFLFNRDMVVQDYGRKGPNKALRRLDGVKIGGTFNNPDGVKCYRPKDAVDSDTWYGIPIIDPENGEPNMIAEAELFNTNLSLAERSSIRHGRLTAIEKYVTVPLAKATARSSILRRYADKVKQNKE